MPHIVISGTSRRLGLALTHHFLDQGWHVHALTRAPVQALDTLQRHQDRLHCHVCPDYAVDAVSAAVSAILATTAKVTALIHNASAFPADEVLRHRPWEAYDHLFQVHMRLPAQLTHELAPALQRAGEGHPGGSAIVTISDIFADQPSPRHSLYCSTKAGLQNLALSWASQLAPTVRSNVIQPGPVQFLPEHTDDQKAQVARQTLLPVEPGFGPILQAIQATLDNPFMTGSIVRVDGGRALGRR